jgi:uncharacterized protein (DUF1778 family)
VAPDGEEIDERRLCVDNSNTWDSPSGVATASANLHLRITPKKKRLLQQAAKAAHAATLTEYVVSSALRQAELDLLERRTFVISGKDWDAFNRLLDAPARVVPALRNLAAAGDVFKRNT